MDTDNDQSIELVYDVYDGSDELMPPLPPVVILHGIFDCKENWKELGKDLSEQSIRMVYVPDIRNHGNSPKTSDFSFSTLINDAERFIEKLNEPVVLIGHSLGGCIASAVALKRSDLVDRLILIDMSPVDYPLETENKITAAGFKLQEVLQDLPKNLDYNKAIACVQKIFEERNINPLLRKIALPTLAQTKDGYQWNTNFSAVYEHICVKKTVRNTYPLPGTFNKKALVVHGSLSNYIRPKNYAEIRRTLSNVTINCINGSDHWIHVEKRTDLLNCISSFLLK